MQCAGDVCSLTEEKPIASSGDFYLYTSEGLRRLEIELLEEELD